jgi:very-short-patch-repair endonuclease
VGRVRRVTDGDLQRLAGRYRVLTYDQLRASGLSKSAVQHRVRDGRLRWLWWGVYLVGPAPPHPLSLAHAASLTPGTDGCISHGWAFFVWGVIGSPSLPVDVTVTSGSRDGRPGNVVVHRSTILEPRDVTTRHGIAVTTPARALLDVAPGATMHELERLFSDAQVAKILTEPQLTELLNRSGRHKGAAKLRALMHEAPGVTLSRAERILRRLLRDAGLPQPITNHPIGPYKADFAWPEQKLIVEFDSFGAHGNRRAFHHDRRRNAQLTAWGWSVLPVTWEQLREEPMAVVARIASALAMRRTAPGQTA